jgi:hypothetical protein
MRSDRNPIGRPTARKPCPKLICAVNLTRWAFHRKGLLARPHKAPPGARGMANRLVPFTMKPHPINGANDSGLHCLQLFASVQSQIPAGEAIPFEVKSGAIIDPQRSRRDTCQRTVVPGRTKCAPTMKFLILFFFSCLWDRLLTNPTDRFQDRKGLPGMRKWFAESQV